MIALDEAQQVLKSEIDTIVENINLTNSMIDEADPRDKSGCELIVELVHTIKSAEPRLIETITNVDQSDLVDYALKVNEDCQSTVRRFKQLQKGERPEVFTPSHVRNNFNKVYEEEVKLELSSDGGSEVKSKHR